jgi:pimeloyl-ACP methyl ester carboxylesterase
MIDASGDYKSSRQRQLERHSVRGLRYALHCWPGSGPETFFLLHGYGDCGPTFELLVDALPASWNIIAPDWRGFGDSEWTHTGYWFPDYLADLDRILELKCPAQPANLIGHSMGGNVAAFYAGIQPRRIKRLALLEGFGLRDTRPADAADRYAKWLGQVRRQRPSRLYESVEQIAASIRRRYPELTPEEARFAARYWSRPEGDGWILKSDPSHQWINPVLYRRSEAETCWQQITAPVLTVSGANSPFAEGNVEFAAHLPAGGDHQISHEQLPDVGHMFHLQAPQLLASVLTNFLQEPLP